MGVDFLYLVRRTFKRRWDRGREDFIRPNLFSGQPAGQPRTVLMAIRYGALVAPGEELLLRPSGNALAAYSRDNVAVGECESPPADVMTAIRQHGGAAIGLPVKVHDLSQTADVAVQ